ncbi:uncharacterized protein LOC132702422 [Cylas formicarius]|uniref:uncharacterized protein LOC132702422 n=1 Tax=Cylas formicarius TaxID=197179 RepID=UPI002958DB8B|nr:uncharacterized protein LOC132702422 [Cylas formicarius]
MIAEMLKISIVWLLVPYIQCFLGFGVKQITPPITKLGESLFWDIDKQAIYLVDVLGSTVYQHIHGSNEVTYTKIVSKTIGAAIPIEGKAGEFIVAAYQDLLRLEWDGTNNTGKATKLKRNFEFSREEQFYEAKVDAKGRMWIGTYQVIDREKYQWVEGGGSLYMITVNKDDSVKIERKLANLTFPSGLGWTFDNRIMFHIDAKQGKIRKYKFDLDSGNLGEGKVFFSQADHPHITGGMDGIAMKEHHITVLLYNGTGIIDIDQETAEIVYIVSNPVPLPTSIVFGGPNNKTAYFASSDYRLTEQEKRLNPYDSKAVFVYSGGHFPNLQAYKIRDHILVPSVDFSRLGTLIRQITEPVQYATVIYWDHSAQAQYYVDIAKGTVYRHKYMANASTHTKVSEGTVGAIIPIKGKKDEFIVGAEHDIVHLTWNGENGSGNLTKLRKDGVFGENEVLNEGATDAKGRLWINTYQAIDLSKMSFKQGGGSLYMVTVNKDKSITIEKKLGDLTFPNGIAWSKDNEYMYIVDSTPRTISKIQFDLQKGQLGKSSVLFKVEDYPKLQGYPDGLTINKDGSLSVALNGGYSILKVNGESGKLEKQLLLPVPNPTAVTWCGQSYDQLCIATEQSDTPTSEAPSVFDSGAIYVVRKLSTSGEQAHKIELK